MKMMMKKRKRLRWCALTVLAVSFLVLEITKTMVPADDYQMKIEAAVRTKACMEFVHQLKLERGVPIDMANDVNQTGVIGQEYSGITTTLGSLEAKRTSTNPNMAAIVIDMFQELGLKEGDQVAINCSGSFPALNMAVMCAAETMGLDPILMSSFGSSTHGANDPELTYLDMEHFLYKEGLLSHKSRYFSIGGMLDMGLEMQQSEVKQIVERLTGYGYEKIYSEDLIGNVKNRYKLYDQYGDIRCFINVGGNDVAFGDSSVMVHADGGLLTELSEKDHSTGLVQLFLKDGIPVIHLLNMKGLAADYGLPVDPVPIPEIGQGSVYYMIRYETWIAVVGFAVSFLLLWLGRENKKRNTENERRMDTL